MKNWKGARNADKFGPRCMQRTGPTSDYWFRSNGMSEDCLYLNVWTPAKSGKERLPVLVYIFGGGFTTTGTSQPFDPCSITPIHSGPAPRQVEAERHQQPRRKSLDSDRTLRGVLRHATAATLGR